MKISLQDIDETNKLNYLGKEKLQAQLNDQDYLISATMKKYLQDLLNLNYSAVKDVLDINQRKTASNLDIYKKITVYNIYYRALEILKQYDRQIIITDNLTDNLSAYTNDNGNIKLIYSFDYINNIANITLNKLVTNAAKIKQLEDTIKYLKYKEYYNLVHGGEAFTEYTEKINKLENDIKKLKLENKYNMKHENEVLNNNIVDLFAEEYGLKNKGEKELKLRRKELPNILVETKLNYK